MRYATLRARRPLPCEAISAYHELRLGRAPNEPGLGPVDTSLSAVAPFTLVRSASILDVARLASQYSVVRRRRRAVEDLGIGLRRSLVTSAARSSVPLSWWRYIASWLNRSVWYRRPAASHALFPRVTHSNLIFDLIEFQRVILSVICI